METPQVRPGLVKSAESMPRVVAFFYNSAQGNLVIQILMQLGIPNDRLGVTPPEQIEGGQGMILSIGCPDETMLARVESICRAAGGRDPPPAALSAETPPPAIHGARPMIDRASHRCPPCCSPASRVWIASRPLDAAVAGTGRGPLVRPGRARRSGRASRSSSSTART